MNEFQSLDLVIKTAVHVKSRAEAVKVHEAVEIEPVIEVNKDGTGLSGKARQVVDHIVGLFVYPSGAAGCVRTAVYPDEYREIRARIIRHADIHVKAVLARVTYVMT